VSFTKQQENYRLVQNISEYRNNRTSQRAEDIPWFLAAMLTIWWSRVNITTWEGRSTAQQLRIIVIIKKNRLVIVFAHAYPLLYLQKIVCRKRITHMIVRRTIQEEDVWPYKIRCTPSTSSKWLCYLEALQKFTCCGWKI
jgi:hypothetical protein